MCWVGKQIDQAALGVISAVLGVGNVANWVSQERKIPMETRLFPSVLGRVAICVDAQPFDFSSLGAKWPFQNWFSGSAVLRRGFFLVADVGGKEICLI